MLVGSKKWKVLMNNVRSSISSRLELRRMSWSRGWKVYSCRWKVLWFRRKKLLGRLTLFRKSIGNKIYKMALINRFISCSSKYKLFMSRLNRCMTIFIKLKMEIILIITIMIIVILIIVISIVTMLTTIIAILIIAMLIIEVWIDRWMEWFI